MCSWCGEDNCNCVCDQCGYSYYWGGDCRCNYNEEEKEEEEMTNDIWASETNEEGESKKMKVVQVWFKDDMTPWDMYVDDGTYADFRDYYDSQIHEVRYSDFSFENFLAVEVEIDIPEIPKTVEDYQKEAETMAVNYDQALKEIIELKKKLEESSAQGDTAKAIQDIRTEVMCLEKQGEEQAAIITEMKRQNDDLFNRNQKLIQENNAFRLRTTPNNTGGYRY